MLEELRADLILVVEDVHETSEGIESLLKADGYRVALARDEVDAIESAKLRRPDLILLSQKDCRRYRISLVTIEIPNQHGGAGDGSRLNFGLSRAIFCLR